jgi:hypothetical protein
LPRWAAGRRWVDSRSTGTNRVAYQSEADWHAVRRHGCKDPVAVFESEADAVEWAERFSLAATVYAVRMVAVPR